MSYRAQVFEEALKQIAAKATAYREGKEANRFTDDALSHEAEARAAAALLEEIETIATVATDRSQ
jgi:hypothetical protein